MCVCIYIYIYLYWDGFNKENFETHTWICNTRPENNNTVCQYNEFKFISTSCLLTSNICHLFNLPSINGSSCKDSLPLDTTYTCDNENDLKQTLCIFHNSQFTYFNANEYSPKVFTLFVCCKCCIRFSTLCTLLYCICILYMPAFLIEIILRTQYYICCYCFNDTLYLLWYNDSYKWFFLNLNRTNAFEELLVIFFVYSL